MSVAIINKPSFTNEVEGLFGIFDGGRNDEVVKLIVDNVDKTMLGEIHHQTTHHSYMKYTMLALHRLVFIDCYKKLNLNLKNRIWFNCTLKNRRTSFCIWISVLVSCRIQVFHVKCCYSVYSILAIKFQTEKICFHETM